MGNLDTILKDSQTVRGALLQHWVPSMALHVPHVESHIHVPSDHRSHNENTRLGHCRDTIMLISCKLSLSIWIMSPCGHTVQLST